MHSKYMWSNGSIIEKKDFKFSPLDHGLTTGDGVFETMAAYNGKVFEMDLHMKRMLRSAEGLGIEVESQVETIKKAIYDLIKANGDEKTERLKIRLTVTGGDANLGSDKGVDPQPFIYIASMPFSLYPQETKIVTVPWPRNEKGALCGFKTISYGENVRALAFAKKHGGSEALFLNTKGELCEGTGSNLFWVKDGKIFTPPLSSGCLAGITRHSIIELAKKNNMPLEEKTSMPNEILSADEAFLSSSLREVQSIKFVDNHAIKNSNGPVTQKMNKLFLEKAFS